MMKKGHLRSKFETMQLTSNSNSEVSFQVYLDIYPNWKNLEFLTFQLTGLINGSICLEIG